MSNPWLKLQRLLPQEPVKVGTSQGHNGDGTTDVILVGGGTVRATGRDYPLGQPVFIKAGVILGQAPSLSPVDITV